MSKKSTYLHEFFPVSFRYIKNYSWLLFRKDLLAGITVGVVALPLAMAFGIASGVPPVQGLYTAIVAGFLISLLGGSSYQIGGPTGAFIVLIYTVIEQVGYNGLVISTIVAGLLLLLAAFSRLGSFIKYVPYPLILGFTSGIALLIFSSQIKDFLGLQIDQVPANFLLKCIALIAALPTLQLTTFLFSLSTLAVIILIRKFAPFIPWGISSIAIMTLVSWGFHLPLETIASRFGELPRSLPTFTFPNLMISIEEWRAILPNAIAIAFLAGIESLLSAIVADGMTGKRHKSNCELMGQGFANIASALFGGIPATGAIARTATNIKSGAATPVAGMIHALILLIILLLFAPIVSHIPLAALSAILVMIAWNMSEAKHFKHLFKAPIGDIVILLTTFFLTVTVDLIAGIGIGMIMAILLFMKRMSDLSKVVSSPLLQDGLTEIEKPDPDAIDKKRVPPGVEVYEITGLFFFGLADSLKNVLSNLESPPKVFILRMRKIPVIDASGMAALQELYTYCKKDHTTLILSGVKPTVLQRLKKFGLVDLIGEEFIFPHIDPSLEKARSILG